MRNHEEIEQALERLDSEPGRLDWHGDNFRFGFLMGKLVALEWALSDAPSSDLTSDFDYEDWRREEKEAGEDIKRLLRGPEPD